MVTPCVAWFVAAWRNTAGAVHEVTKCWKINGVRGRWMMDDDEGQWWGQWCWAYADWCLCQRAARWWRPVPSVAAAHPWGGGKLWTCQLLVLWGSATGYPPVMLPGSLDHPPWPYTLPEAEWPKQHVTDAMHFWIMRLPMSCILMDQIPVAFAFCYLWKSATISHSSIPWRNSSDPSAPTLVEATLKAAGFHKRVSCGAISASHQ